MNIEIIAAGVAVMVMSLGGVLFSLQFARSFLETRLPFLISFSAGVFLVTAGAIILEAFHVLDATWYVVGFVIVGYLLAWVLQWVLPESHHHHTEQCGRSHGGARKLLIGDGIHNVVDGVMLVSAFLVSPVLGVAATASVMIHEALQEVSEFFVLRQSGYSSKAALVINFAVSGTIFIGIGIGYYVASAGLFEGVLLALSGGFFLHVVVHDLWPRRTQYSNLSVLAGHLIVVGAGASLMAGVNLWLQDEHTHGHQDEEYGHEEMHAGEDHEDVEGVHLEQEQPKEDYGQDDHYGETGPDSH